MSSFPLEHLTESRLQLHYAVQLIAATGAALAVPQADGGHSSLRWDAEHNLFVGAVIPAATPFQVALDPINLIAFILDQSSQKLAEFALDQQTMADGLDWLKAAIAKLGVNPDAITFLAYPPDDFPDHALAHGAAFHADQAGDRAILAHDYARTNRLLQGMRGAIATASPIYIWPHHFDLATLVSLPGTKNGESLSIGIGFSPGDSSYPEPYWYVSPYPYPDVANLPPLAGSGGWHTTDWVGAVLTASQLGQDSKTAQIDAFLDSAFSASQTLLTA